RAIADSVPEGTYRTLQGQTHMVEPNVLAPVLAEFFAQG
ncbi:alpha/beta hydrolase, partial [Streptomyces sp. NPDC006386]